MWDLCQFRNKCYHIDHIDYRLSTIYRHLLTHILLISYIIYCSHSLRCAPYARQTSTVNLSKSKHSFTFIYQTCFIVAINCSKKMFLTPAAKKENYRQMLKNEMRAMRDNNDGMYFRHPIIMFQWFCFSGMFQSLFVILLLKLCVQGPIGPIETIYRLTEIKGDQN